MCAIDVTKQMWFVTDRDIQSIASKFTHKNVKENNLLLFLMMNEKVQKKTLNRKTCERKQSLIDWYYKSVKSK